ncbi:MAG: AAA family ATPase [Victivallaceae bacterium]|nr:AAA family ATPase [Victivallaceae bacterium]
MNNNENSSIIREKLSRYAFRRMPFTDEISEAYLDEHRRQSLNLFREFLQFRGFALLSGEPGCGKSYLLNHLCGKLPGNTHKVMYIPFSQVGDSDMLKLICHELGIENGMSRSRMLKVIQKCVEDMQPVNPILVLDECQITAHKTLETIRLLANFHFEEKNFFSVIMAGTEDFVQMLRLRINTALMQRITLHRELKALTREKTQGYIEHHFNAAGVQHEILSPQAIERVFTASSGVPRVIDNLVRIALREAAEDNQDRVELEHVRKGMINCMPTLLENEIK